MDPRAPQLCVLSQGDVLWLSYRTRRADHFAVLRFSGVEVSRFGESLDPGLLARLRDASFLAVGDPALHRSGLGRWVAAFGDEVVDVTAREAAVVVRAIEARDGGSALAMVRG